MTDEMINAPSCHKLLMTDKTITAPSFHTEVMTDEMINAPSFHTVLMAYCAFISHSIDDRWNYFCDF